MKNLVQRLSVRTRLVLLMLAAAIGALVVGGLTLLVLDERAGRRALEQELATLARVLAGRSSAALVFRDDGIAAATLAELRHLPHVELACLLLPDGQPLAQYARDAGARCEASAPADAGRADGDPRRLVIELPVHEGSQFVGNLRLQADTGPLGQRRAVLAASLALAVLPALALVMLLSLRLQRVVSQPLARLRGVADTIFRGGDTSLRSPDLGPNEIGALGAAFNRMLDTVEQQKRDLATREDRSRRLFGDSGVAQLVMHGVAGECIDCNAAAAALLGLPDPAAMRGRHLSELAAPGTDAATLLRALQARLDAGASADGDVPLERAADDGGRQRWDASLSVIALPDSPLVHCTLRDASAERAAERSRAAQQAAEAASRAKTEFISRMSHELRTPLNAVLGFLQLLQRDAASRMGARERQQIELASQAGWHLLALINDVLDIARIEAGRLKLELVPTPLHDVLRTAAALCEAQAESAGVRLLLLAGATAPAWVQADSTRLRQVLLNLLSNAIKYNRPQGEVRVAVGPVDAGFEIRIDDTGIGMAPAQLAQLYQPFNRLGREGGPAQGFGIGLALARELVLAMHGTLAITSTAGAGTRAVVRLPAAAADDIAAGAPLPTDAPGPAEVAPAPATVLYIEDNPVNAILVEQCLARCPEIAYRHAADGASGLAALEGQRVDLVLLDMHLPDMTGIELLDELRQSGRLARAPVVALSASAMPDEVEAATAAGAADYWTKPIELDRFVGRVRRLLQQRQHPPA